MHDLVHQRAAARGDVHDERTMRRRVITKRRCGAIVKNFPHVRLVAGFVFEEPKGEAPAAAQRARGPVDCPPASPEVANLRHKPVQGSSHDSEIEHGDHESA